MFRELVVLGECCKDFKHFRSYKDLHSLLADMASALALTPDRLLKADWFIQVLDHPRNSSGAKDNFELYDRAKARRDVKVGLRCFHALLRNVLCHGFLEEQRAVLQAYPSKLADFHTSGRISEVLTKTYDGPKPGRSAAQGVSAAATPRAQSRPHAGPVLDHPRNSSGAKDNFELYDRAKARRDVKVGLRCFHALLRNVLCHGFLEEQRAVLQAYPSKLADFHTSGRISEVLTKTYDGPKPGRSAAQGVSAAATPRAQSRPHAGPVRPIPLRVGKLLGRAAVVQPRYVGRM
ncbi:hypothetical protein GPECTOR_9g682 [Gonium pectorale]|uniref:Uncharacterized protein n=1 Tax=Gonium pectorale TaxID=33097 RepID=A0A150GS20_GONPE|nr:hypothetical protein GPECTOR_9g682 [Gonium pectorale]|eukprot:KXZ52637.1 hypothetical protein GPECTOR_9g682 [Gonium pectorale]